MTVVVNNASNTFFQALKAMAKLDGASVFVEEYTPYPKSFIRTILKADKRMEKDRKKGKLKLYDSVDDLFQDL